MGQCDVYDSRQFLDVGLCYDYWVQSPSGAAGQLSSPDR